MYEDDPRQLMVPADMDYYEFYITLVARDGEEGQDPSLTPRLWMLKEGDRLWMGPKVTGHYTWTRWSGRPGSSSPRPAPARRPTTA